MSTFGFPTSRWRRMKVSRHRATMLLHCCAGWGVEGGWDNAEEAEREPICQPHEPWQSQSQWRSNSTPASPTDSGEVDQFLAVRPSLIENSSPSRVVKLQKQTHEYQWFKKGPGVGYRSGGSDHPPLAVDLWWSWSFSPSPLWEIWSRGEKKTTKTTKTWIILMRHYF